MMTANSGPPIALGSLFQLDPFKQQVTNRGVIRPAMKALHLNAFDGDARHVLRFTFAHANLTAGVGGPSRRLCLS